MADLVFIVSRADPRRYRYLKHVFADDSSDVVVDRRMGERCRSLQPPLIERCHIDRRQRDITGELQTAGWALGRRPVTYTGTRLPIRGDANRRAYFRVASLN